MNKVPGFTVPNRDECDLSLQVGDFVRSYDTGFADDSYVEGPITTVGNMIEGHPRYEIQIYVRMVSGRILTPGSYAGTAAPPINGIPHAFGGYTNGVRKIIH